MCDIIASILNSSVDSLASPLIAIQVNIQYGVLDVLYQGFLLFLFGSSSFVGMNCNLVVIII